ncbi:ABC-F family ATP-binding cassette domain-containing protein [Syntrophomonas curvata]
MVIFQANNINKSFGEHQVLKSAALVLQEKDRVGLVGVNGSGKTTLLKCLTGEIEADSGEIAKPNSLTLAYLEQLPQVEAAATVWEAMMDSFADILQMRRHLHGLEQQMGRKESRLEKIMGDYARVMEQYERAGGYACEASARRIMLGLGFNGNEMQKPFKALSGGEKTRLNLGRLLAVQADIIMLDEPTNHLDMPSVEWLEEWLNNYPGTVLLVSHDRMFLDRVVSRVVELKDGALISYPGNYSRYLQLKARSEEARLRAYEKQQEFIRENEEYIRKYKAGIKSRQARGRQSQLQRLERLEKTGEDKNIGSWSLKPELESGQEVLLLRDITKSFGSHTVLAGIGFTLRKGEKTAVIGPNGCGKSTLLKIILGIIEPDQGEVKLGSRVKAAYFSQEFEDLDPGNTVLDEIMDSSGLDLASARSLLGRMLFRGDDVFKPVASLSGGEKGRLCLLKVILSGANFLVLDEPTNHLDIASRQAAEELLSGYLGTVLLVSHDRYFIDRLATRVAALDDKKLTFYPGNYSYYHEKLKQLQASQSAPAKNERKENSKQQHFRTEQKNWQREARRLQSTLQTVEEEISRLEDRKAELERILADPGIYTGNERARVYSSEYQHLEEELASAYTRWERSLEEIENHHGNKQVLG